MSLPAPKDPVASHSYHLYKGWWHQNWIWMLNYSGVSSSGTGKQLIVDFMEVHLLLLWRYLIPQLYSRHPSNLCICVVCYHRNLLSNYLAISSSFINDLGHKTLSKSLPPKIEIVRTAPAPRPIYVFLSSLDWISLSLSSFSSTQDDYSPLGREQEAMDGGSFRTNEPAPLDMLKANLVILVSPR